MRETGETLAKFDALENVKTVRRALASHEDLTVDSAGLLAVHTPLREPAVQMQMDHAMIGPERVSSVVKSKAQKAQALFQRAKHWTQDPARIWIVGLSCVIAVGLLTFMILMLTDSI
jgi:hypothetical protein